MRNIFTSLLLLITIGEIFCTSTTTVRTARLILEQYMNGKPKEAFKVWHLIFQKEYSLESEEAKQRYQIFKAKFKKIQLSNQQLGQFRIGLNQFSDLSFQEFSSLFNLNKEGQIPQKVRPFLEVDEDDDLMKRNLQTWRPIDYRPLYKAVKNQVACSACWAFVVAGAIDGMRAKVTSVPVEETSPQNLIDCDSANGGCVAGNYAKAFDYVKTNGLFLLKDYPYLGKKDQCKSQFLSSERVYINGVDYCDDNQTKVCGSVGIYSLLEKGPVSVSINVTPEFQDYEGGIFVCGDTQGANHAVVVVGYGIEGSTSYWIIRNSWDTWWGEQGYGRVAVNEKNKSCWITNRGYQPILNQ